MTSSKIRQNGMYFLLFIVVGIAITKSLKFGESYLTLFLVHDKRLSEYEVNNQIFPVWTYSDAIFRILIVALSVILSPELLILFEMLSQTVTYALLVFVEGGHPNTLFWMVMMQVTYGMATASSSGFYGCVSSYLEPAVAAKWNAHIKSLVFAGHVFACLSAGILISHFSLWISFALTLIFLVVALFFSILMLVWSIQRKGNFDRQAEETLREDIFIPNANVLLLTSAWIFIFCALGLCENYFSSLVYRYASNGNIDAMHSGYFDALGKIASFCSSLYLSFTSWWQKDHRTAFLICIISTVAMAYSMITLSLLGSSCTYIRFGCLWAVLMSTGSAVGTMLTSKAIEQLNCSGKMVTFYISVKSMVSMAIMSLLQFVLDGHTACGRFYILGWVGSIVPILLLLICIFTVNRVN